MKKKVFFAALAAVCCLITTGCGSDDETPDSGSKVEITTQLTTAPAIHADQPYAPEGGKLTLLCGSMSASGNQRAEFTCTAGNWAANPALMWEGLTPGGDGKYPFFAAAPTVPTATPAVAADQSTTAEYVKSDQLMAYTVVQNKKAVTLIFKHILSQLTVILVPVATTAPDYLDLSAATITIGGAKTGYTVSFPAPTAELPAVAIATGNASASLKPLIDGTGADRKHYLVLPAQDISVGALTITVTVDGKARSWTNEEALTLVAGQQSGLSLTVSKSTITLGSSATVEPWTPVDEGEVGTGNN